MFKRLRAAQRAGFTLMEILVAAALIGVVMTMALQAFMGLQNITAVTRSKLVAGSEASKGVHGLAALLRRAHVIYYTGRPISGAVADFPAGQAGAVMTAATLVGTAANEPPTDPIPNALGANGPASHQAGRTRYKLTDPTNRAFALNDPLYVELPRARFRFWDWGPLANNNTLNTPDQRLRTNDPAAVRPYDLYFPSPLMYLAEASFAVDAVGGAANGTIENMFQPLSWTFYVVYLSPMNAEPNQPAPSWVASRKPIDRVPANSAAGWFRSTIPFELRVLTVPGVEADRDGNRDTAQRILADGTLPKPPYDYMPNNINYHPVPIPHFPGTANTASYLAAAQRRLERPPAPMANAGGARVRNGSGQTHPNFNNIGNDPPSQAVFDHPRLGDARPNDKVLAQYVDPDNVHGTCVRLLNTLGAAPTSADQREAFHAPPPAFGEYRRYLNAYGGEFLYNHYASLVQSPPAAAWNTAMGATLPRRALLSVATRYRTDSRVPFQFASEIIELDLENIVRFQSLNGSMNL
ncbi:MAG: type II secretion system protein [Candidatus Sericytochromatia bacterium]